MGKLTEEEQLFRKIEEKVKKAIFEYGLISDGDRIMIGLSGGKDSLALVELLGRRSKIFRPRFEIVVVHIVMSNIPYRSDLDYLKSCADAYGLPFIVHETSFDAATDTRKSPCFLCSWMRRKALFDLAKQHNCNKIALGHHQDDLLQTLLMNLIHQGAFGTMPPKLKMNKFDMEIIRPLCLVEEKELIRMAEWRGYRKQIKNCPYESGSSRSRMKEVLAAMEQINPKARYSLWGSMNHIQEDYLPRKIDFHSPAD
ncbi:MAG: tRNA 2-thiocytidine biosynthesis TtcA family protein [Tannerellaceae bacterium]|nr:tRNA 2-thiocytidine biosynthesis TtcA family protein [Tannerellaceae bacterium]